MGAWRDEELRQDRFTGRDDDQCWLCDRDWSFLLEQKTLSECDREELHRVLAQIHLSEAEVLKIKLALSDEVNDGID
jgi:hypothetical protein